MSLLSFVNILFWSAIFNNYEIHTFPCVRLAQIKLSFMMSKKSGTNSHVSSNAVLDGSIRIHTVWSTVFNNQLRPFPLVVPVCPSLSCLQLSSKKHLRKLKQILL